MMNNCELTIIIPFKNEGDEVEKTIYSLSSMMYYKNTIIVINDGSDDGYHYRNSLNGDNIIYIEHDKSMGVAGSRDHGIALCKTEYFIMLDAHMRAYTKNWDVILLQELKKNKRAIFCCRTINIDEHDNIRYTDYGGMGVILNINDLSYVWNDKYVYDDNNVSNSFIVPCVMGASYSSNVDYWKRLHGLYGLRSYGYDEQLISIKTYLEGGECRAIGNILWGHKFRTALEVPYNIKNIDFIFNKFYIIEIFFPWKEKTIILHNLKTEYGDEIFNNAVTLIGNVKDKILKEKKYYRQIFCHDFSYLKEIICNFKSKIL